MAKEILPRLHAVFFPKLSVNAFLIEGEDGLTLVDAGIPGGGRKLLAAVEAVGGEVHALRTIVVTHYHSDHVGALADVAAAETGARVHVHPLDAEVVRTGADLPKAHAVDAFGKVLSAIFDPITPKRSPAARVDEEVEDGAVIRAAGGLRVIHTPGHTPGHISILWPEHGGVLFVGDALGNSLGMLAYSIKYEDFAVARASLRKLATLEFDKAVFGHGRLLDGKANVAFRRFVERRASRSE